MMCFDLPYILFTSCSPYVSESSIDNGNFQSVWIGDREVVETTNINSCDTQVNFSLWFFTANVIRVHAYALPVLGYIATAVNVVFDDFPDWFFQ